MRNLVIYDMDKTITRKATYSAFLLHMARTKAPWRLVFIPVSAVFGCAYLLRLLSRERLKEYNQMLFLGRSAKPQPISGAINSYADKVLGNNCMAQARAQIAHDKAEGCTILMATASYELYAQAIGSKIGCDDVLGTKLKLDNLGHILADIDGDNCYGEAKLVRIQQWLSEHGGAESWNILRCYSDHVSDTPMLELAREPVAVNPHAPLKAMAEQRGWRIALWS
ncbi:HAD family hydrolase [Parasphingorhabdus sp. DH2-15]|uniref:HAD family hydrolase n=1 Tax=Parasphingorhabdus sp. DH2-15 TaxID=3444112 RepID=UPI003F6827F5